MYILSLLLTSFLACGSKTNDSASSEDTSSTSNTEDTGSSDTGSSDTGSSDTGSSDTGSSDTGSSEDTGSTEDTSDSGDTRDAPDDTGEAGVNSSETPPTGSCYENNVSLQYGDNTYSLGAFWWDMSEDADGVRVLFVGFNSGDVDVCSGLVNMSPMQYAQGIFEFTPILSELPQTVGLGIFDVDTNVSGSLLFVPDPTAESPDLIYSREGEAVINSVILGENGLLTEINIGQMDLDTSGGAHTSFETLDVQLSGGESIIGCYCDGLKDFYDNF